MICERKNGVREPDGLLVGLDFMDCSLPDVIERVVGTGPLHFICRKIQPHHGYIHAVPVFPGLAVLFQLFYYFLS